MIIVKLMGGLGNQMFQYALGRNLAIKRDTVLKLDMSYLEGKQEGVTKRKYELGHLKTDATIATPLEIAETSGRPGNLQEYILVKLRKITGMSSGPAFFYKQKNMNYDSSVMELPENVYLEGYWQTERYFKDIEDVIRREFEMVSSLEGANLEMAKRIRSVEAVSIHIRRGDYLSNPQASRMHSVCDLNYYQSAINMISSKISMPEFFVFSDDLEWAEKNLHSSHPITYVDINRGETGHEDMRLMSLCKHNIIANSSFSWWGAWLNRHGEKIVLAPGEWFKDPEIDVSDLLPSNWIRL